MRLWRRLRAGRGSYLDRRRQWRDGRPRPGIGRLRRRWFLRRSVLRLRGRATRIAVRKRHLGNRVKSDAARGLVVANVSVARAGVILGWVGVGLALLRTLGYLASVAQNSM